jgi:hypothetical protein
MARSFFPFFLMMATLLLSVPADGALFSDSFSGANGSALDAGKWNVTTDDFTVQQSGGWAVFSSSTNYSGDHGTALTDDAWDPDDYTLTWSIDFKSTGGDMPRLDAFLFDSPAGVLKVYDRYGDSYFVIEDAGGVATSLTSNGTALGSKFKPASGNAYTQGLTVVVDASNITAILSATTDGTNYTDYYRTVAHNLNTVASSEGHFGMKVWEGSVGASTSVSFDNAFLTPEPATLALMGFGMAGILWVSRRRYGKGR